MSPSGPLKIKGSVLRSRLSFVEEQAGAGGLERVLAQLSAEHRETLARLLPAGWYPFDLGKELDEAIVAVLGGGDESYFLRLGRDSATRNLTGVHRAFVRPGSQGLPAFVGGGMLRHAWGSVRPGRWCDALALLADAAPSAGINPSYAADVDAPRAAATAGGDRGGTPGHASGTSLPPRG